MKKLDMLVNIAILATFLMVGFVFVKSQILIRAPTPITIGETMRGLNVNWKSNGTTLLFVLNRECRYCEQSVPFYKRLIEHAGHRAKLVAAFPLDTSEAKEYLDKHNLHFDEVVKINPGSFRVRGTPTLIFVNSRGVVSNIWTGRLLPDKELEVFSAVSQ